jgi:hypothetical protein
MPIGRGPRTRTESESVKYKKFARPTSNAVARICCASHTAVRSASTIEQRAVNAQKGRDYHGGATVAGAYAHSDKATLMALRCEPIVRASATACRHAPIGVDLLMHKVRHRDFGSEGGF